MIHDPIQESVDADRSYIEWSSRLRAEDAALREEHRRLSTTPAAPNAELQNRVRSFIAAESTAVRQSLRAAVNGPDMESALRELVPPALFALFPMELSAALADLVDDDSSTKKARLAEIEKRNKEIETILARGYEEHRAATAPVQR
jgi:hypothetical protein